MRKNYTRQLYAKFSDMPEAAGIKHLLLRKNAYSYGVLDGLARRDAEFNIDILITLPSEERTAIKGIAADIVDSVTAASGLKVRAHSDVPEDNERILANVVHAISARMFDNMSHLPSSSDAMSPLASTIARFSEELYVQAARDEFAYEVCEDDQLFKPAAEHICSTVLGRSVDSVVRIIQY